MPMFSLTENNGDACGRCIYQQRQQAEHFKCQDRNYQFSLASFCSTPSAASFQTTLPTTGNASHPSFHALKCSGKTEGKAIYTPAVNEPLGSQFSTKKAQERPSLKNTSHYKRDSFQKVHTVYLLRSAMFPSYPLLKWESCPVSITMGTHCKVQICISPNSGNLDTIGYYIFTLLLQVLLVRSNYFVSQFWFSKDNFKASKIRQPMPTLNNIVNNTIFQVEEN